MKEVTKEIERTFEELIKIDNMMGSMFRVNPKLLEGKFGYAYKRFSEKNLSQHLKQFREELTDIRIEHALTDEKTKEIIFDKESDRGFKYSKEGLKEVLKAERKLDEKWDKKVIKIVPYIMANDGLVDVELTEIQKEAFTGLFI